MKGGGGSTACSSASSSADTTSSLDEEKEGGGDAPNCNTSAASTHSEQDINDNAVPIEDIFPPMGSSNDVDNPKGEDIHKSDPPPILEEKTDDGMKDDNDEEDADVNSSQVSSVGQLITATRGAPAGLPGANLLNYHEKPSFNPVTTQTFDIASHGTKDVNHMTGSESEDLTPWGEWNDTLFPLRSEGNEHKSDGGTHRSRLSTAEESEGYYSSPHTVVKLKRLPTAQEIDDLDNRIKEANRKVFRERQSLMESENALMELVSQRVKVYKGEVSPLDLKGFEDDDDTDSSDASPEAFDMCTGFESDAEDAFQQGIIGETSENAKTIRITELTDEEADDVMDSVGIAKCGICGKKIPLNGDQMEEHIMVCEAELERPKKLKDISSILKTDVDRDNGVDLSYAVPAKKSTSAPARMNPHMEQMCQAPSLPGIEPPGRTNDCAPSAIRGSTKTSPPTRPVSEDASRNSGTVTVISKGTEGGKKNLMSKVRTSISKFAFGRK